MARYFKLEGQKTPWCKWNEGNLRPGSQIKDLSSGEVFLIKKILDIKFMVEDNIIEEIIIKCEVENGIKTIDFARDSFEVLE